MTTHPGPDRRGRPPMTALTSTEDRHSPIRLFIDAVKGMTITPFVRVICGVIAVAYGFMAWDPLFHSGSPAYDRPVFEAVFKFASPLAWGVGFATCAIALTLSALTSRAALYVGAISVSAVTLSGWASMVIFKSMTNTNGDSLTSGAYGLYIGTLTSVVGLAFSPRQLAVDKPIIAVLDDGKVVPLKQTG